MAKGMTIHRRARTSPNAPGTGAIGAGLRRLCARGAACRLGSVAIEFAVLLPVFLALIYGLFEFARIAWTQTTLEYAVEEAARFAMVNPTASATQITAVANDSATGLDAGEITITVTFEKLGEREFVSDGFGDFVAEGGGEFVTVDGTYNFVPIVKIVGVGSFNITSTARMPIVIPPD
ncbi:MAG: pilus assembly protein [Proteobacteria bacterium]|nr:pilus assembly protein [Pseudomonadota bacterium]